MTSQDQFKQILKRLLEKSKRNEVHWREQPIANRSPIFTYRVLISDNTIIDVYFGSPESAPDFVVASLNVNGIDVVTLNVEDGEPDYPFLLDLYKEAYRTTTKWDEALNEVEKVLAADGPVGK